MQALVADGHDLAVVVTQPDRRRGRGRTTSPSPVKEAAVALGIPVVHRVAELLDHDVELGVVVAFGQLIKADVLERVPMINLHFSLLPRWRGAAPVERALLAGDEMTGVCLMALDVGLDTGPVYDRREVPIGPEQTADELRAELTAVGTEMLLAALRAPLPEAVPQEGDSTYAAKLGADDLRLDWSQPAAVVHRVIRCGRAFTTFRGRRLLVSAAHRLDAGAGHAPAASTPTPPPAGSLTGAVAWCGDGRAIELVRVKPEGKGEISAADWVRGIRPTDDDRLGS